MKAKLYLHDGKMEARFSDDTNYIPKKDEAKEAFIERLKKIAEDDYLEDLELVEIDKEAVATNDDATLLEAVETAQGLQKKLIEAVLTDRKLIKEKVVRPKVEKQSVEEMKASQHYKDSEANIGKHVSFSPFKSEEVHTGKIAGVALNKTNTIVYYTVVEAGGKRRCCAVKNETIKFIDAPKEEPKAADAKEDKKETKTSKAKKGTTDASKSQSGDAPGADQDPLM